MCCRKSKMCQDVPSLHPSDSCGSSGVPPTGPLFPSVSFLHESSIKPVESTRCVGSNPSWDGHLGKEGQVGTPNQPTSQPTNRQIVSNTRPSLVRPKPTNQPTNKPTDQPTQPHWQSNQETAVDLQHGRVGHDSLASPSTGLALFSQACHMTIKPGLGKACSRTQVRMDTWEKRANSAHQTNQPANQPTQPDTVCAKTRPNLVRAKSTNQPANQPTDQPTQPHWPSNQEKAVDLQHGRVGHDSLAWDTTA
jgi:hypothetical protein